MSNISDMPSTTPAPSSAISSDIVPEKKLDSLVHNTQKSIDEGPQSSSKNAEPRAECVSPLLSSDQFFNYLWYYCKGWKQGYFPSNGCISTIFHLLYLITAECLIRSPQVRLRSAARRLPTILRTGFLQLRHGKTGIPSRSINLHLLWFCPILRHRFCSSLDLNVQHCWPAHTGHLPGVSCIFSCPFTVADSRRDAIYHDHPPASPGPRCQHRIYPPLSFRRCDPSSFAVYVLVVLWI